MEKSDDITNKEAVFILGGIMLFAIFAMYAFAVFVTHSVQAPWDQKSKAVRILEVNFATFPDAYQNTLNTGCYQNEVAQIIFCDGRSYKRAIIKTANGEISDSLNSADKVALKALGKRVRANIEKRRNIAAMGDLAPQPTKVFAPAGGGYGGSGSNNW